MRAGADGPVGEHAIAAIGGITPEVLRKTFPQWRIFRQADQWWAIRGGAVQMQGPESLLLRSITAPDLVGLAERLCLQEYLDQMDPQQLAAVHRDMTLSDGPW